MNKTSLREFLQRYGLAISFLILCLVLSLLSDRFLTIGNLTNVLRQSTINLIIAIGMTYVILTAGIDLSIGPLIALSNVMAATLMEAHPDRTMIISIMIIGVKNGNSDKTVASVPSGLFITA